LKVKEHAARRLSSLQEQILLYTAQAFSASNLGLTPAQIRTIASRLWDIELSPSWVTKWLKRNKKEISHRKCVSLSKNRVDVDQLAYDIENFIDQLGLRYKTLHFPNVAIFNVDETRVSFKETGIQFSRIEWTQREKHNLISTRAEKSSTMITFVSAAGEVLFSCWIFKADFEKSNSQEIEYRIRPEPKTR